MYKIAHLPSAHPPFDSRIFMKECRTLMKAGYEVVVIVPHERDEVVDGVRIRALPKPGGRLERMTRTAWQAYRAAVDEKADVYHLHMPELLPIGQLLRIRGKTIIFDMHENIPTILITKSWVPKYLRKLASIFYRLAENVLLRGMNIIFAESSMKKYYNNILNSAVVLNYPIIDELLSIKASKYKIITIGYLGNVSPARGIISLIQAVNLLQQQGYELEFECVGPLRAVHESEILSYIEKCGSRGIRLQGYKPPSEAWRLIAKCHIGLALLKPTPYFLEIEPTKIFEYMALGLPVIASNLPLCKEIIEKADCGLCVDPADPIAIAEAIQWMMEHPEEADAMGKRGQQAAIERYNWNIESQKLLAFYNKLLPEFHYP